jgi:hypothetical protein
MTMRTTARLAPVLVAVSLGLWACSAEDDGRDTTGRGGSGGSATGSGGSAGTGVTGGTSGTGGSTGGTAGTAGTAGAGGGFDGGSGTASCLEVQNCQNNCRNQPCRDACLAMGTPDAQQLTLQLSQCIDQNCPADAGLPRSCRTDVQCAQDGPCRTLNETCIGQSPDPGCPQ